MARGRRIIEDSSDDEFPDIRQIGSSQSNRNKDARPPTNQPEGSASKGVVRRRKLGPISSNAVLRPSTGRSYSGTLFDDDDAGREKSSTRPRRPETRTKRPSPVVKSLDIEELSGADSVQGETITEDFSGDDESEFEASQSSESEGDGPTAELFSGRPPPRSFKRPGGGSEARKVSGARTRSPSPSAQLLAEASRAQERDDTQVPSSRKEPGSRIEAAFKKIEGQRRTIPTGLAGPFSNLDMYELQPPRSKSTSSDIKRPTTPTSPAPEPRYKSLASPSKKISRIPATPHRPHTDTFWDQEFIDEWNDEHSPKKQLLPPPATTRESPAKKSPARKGPSQAAMAKASRRAFEQSKHELADSFLRELDGRITGGRISELSASTGGVRIEWSNRLNTTAGRANWRRETAAGAMRGDGGHHRHHASIELAEKVIDDEHRLLNVIAHEFCHLANFMISGVTGSPHGSEFKSWAARVTGAFGASRGIEVTTRHSYDIDFRYAWECASCGAEFGRHSRSIDPGRHRCGACRGELRQTRPAPRAGAGAGPGAGESDYQRFMREQMGAVRRENPGCPQRDIMRLVASRWTREGKGKGKGKGKGGGESRDDKEKPGSTSPTSSSSSSSTATATATTSTSSQVVGGGGGKGKVEKVAKTLTTLTLIDLT